MQENFFDRLLDLGTAHAPNCTFASPDTQADASACKSIAMSLSN